MLIKTLFDKFIKNISTYNRLFIYYFLDLFFVKFVINSLVRFVTNSFSLITVKNLIITDKDKFIIHKDNYEEILEILY